MSPDHQVFHRCIQHLETTFLKHCPWLTNPFLGLPSSILKLWLLVLFFYYFFWPNTRPSDWQPSWCQSLGRSPEATESYTSWGSVFKELDQWESGLESLSYGSAPCWVLWLTLEQCGVRPRIAAVHGVAKSQTRLRDWAELIADERTMLWWFQVGKAGTQPCIHMYPFSSKLPRPPVCKLWLLRSHFRSGSSFPLHTANLRMWLCESLGGAQGFALVKENPEKTPLN